MYDAGHGLQRDGTIFSVKPIANGAIFADASGVDLTSTGVISNTYGGESLIPIITVDSKGRITAASTASLPSISISRELVTATTLNAVADGRYNVSVTGGALCTITDPPTGILGQSYTIIVGAGTVKWSTGNTYSVSLFEIVRYCTAPNTWTTLPPLLSDALNFSSNTIAAATLVNLGGGATGIPVFESATIDEAQTAIGLVKITPAEYAALVVAGTTNASTIYIVTE